MASVSTKSPLIMDFIKIGVSLNDETAGERSLNRNKCFIFIRSIKTACPISRKKHQFHCFKNVVSSKSIGNSRRIPASENPCRCSANLFHRFWKALKNRVAFEAIWVRSASSAVEHPPAERVVIGSNPMRFCVFFLVLLITNGNIE